MTDFSRLLEAEIPRLRRYARALTPRCRLHRRSRSELPHARACQATSLAARDRFAGVAFHDSAQSALQ